MNETFPGHTLSHEKRVALYIHKIQSFKMQLTEFHIRNLRASTSNEDELKALNEALEKLGFED